MAAEPGITRDQLKRLQTLWGKYTRHEGFTPARFVRLQRLAWASAQLKREVDTFSQLTLNEASTLINLLQTELGIAETRPNAPRRRYRSRIKDRDLAHAAAFRAGSVRQVALKIATWRTLPARKAAAQQLPGLPPLPAQRTCR